MTSAAPAALTYRRILRFYWPLAMSWLFMGLDGPTSVWVISRRPHPEVNTAGFLILMGLAIWIESPVIDLLSTSTTLAKSTRDWHVLRGFATKLSVGVMLVHAVIALSPLYGWVAERLLGVPAAIAEAARPGLIVMLPWSGLIGWRRTLQGLLIRFDRTRTVGAGTAVRIAAMIGTSLALFSLTSLPSLIVVAVAMIASVLSEALFAHVATRDLVREKFPLRTGEPAALTERRLAAFHFPLTLTTMVNLVASPIIAAGLARSPDAVLVLAAYGVTSTVLFLNRAIAYGLPEVTITLHAEDRGGRLWRFSLLAGACSSGLLVLAAVSGLDVRLFHDFLGARLEVARCAHWAYLASAAVPFLDALHAYVRGMLTAHHRTTSRLVAVAAGTAGLVLTIVAGVRASWPGPAIAGAALTACVATELAVLLIAWRNGDRKSGSGIRL